MVKFTYKINKRFQDRVSKELEGASHELAQEYLDLSKREIQRYALALPPRLKKKYLSYAKSGYIVDADGGSSVVYQHQLVKSEYGEAKPGKDPVTKENVVVIEPPTPLLRNALYTLRQKAPMILMRRMRKIK